MDTERAEHESILFEKAIRPCGFGFFNYCLMLATLAGTLAVIVGSTNTAFVLPAIQCDRNRGLINEALLYVSTYLGMISASIQWGWLGDLYGRRKIIMYAHLLDAILMFASAFATDFVSMCVMKFLSGICISGGFSTLMVYLAEVHDMKTRNYVMLGVGVLLNLSYFIISSSAILIMPRIWNISMGSYKFHCWQCFILVGSIPSLMCYVGFKFLPESPKFLMSQGRLEEALTIFRYIFVKNSKGGPTQYPTQILRFLPSDEFVPAKNRFCNACKIIFGKDLLFVTIGLILVNICVQMCENSLRFWIVTIFANIEEMLKYSKQISISLCNIIDFNNNKTSLMTHGDLPCFSNVSVKVYLKNFYVGIAIMIGFLIAFGPIGSRHNKAVLCTCLLLSSLFGFCITFATNTLQTITLAALYVTVEFISSALLVFACVSFYPTQCRCLATGIFFFFGRAGAVSGNFILPHLVEYGCVAPFIWLGFIGLFAFGVSIFLPNPVYYWFI